MGAFLVLCFSALNPSFSNNPKKSSETRTRIFHTKQTSPLSLSLHLFRFFVLVGKPTTQKKSAPPQKKKKKKRWKPNSHKKTNKKKQTEETNSGNQPKKQKKNRKPTNHKKRSVFTVDRSPWLQPWLWKLRRPALWFGDAWSNSLTKRLKNNAKKVFGLFVFILNGIFMDFWLFLLFL